MAVSGLDILTFNRLNRAGFRTFVTKRAGGVSTGPYSSLNLSYTVGDDAAAVAHNRRRVAQHLGLEPDRLVSARQVHGTGVWHVPSGTQPSVAPDADILLTRHGGVALMVLTADCVPLVMCDPIRKISAAVHAGWRGTVADAAGVAVRTMVEQYRCSAKNIIVGIGPAIAADNYTVGSDVISAVTRAFASPTERAQILDKTAPGRATLDLQRACTLQLLHAGVRQNNIECLTIDTFVSPEQFYSARRQKPFGCFGTGIMRES